MKKPMTVNESKILTKLNLRAICGAEVDLLKPTKPQIKAIKSLVERKYVVILSADIVEGSVLSLTIKDVRHLFK